MVLRLQYRSLIEAFQVHLDRSNRISDIDGEATQDGLGNV